MEYIIIGLIAFGTAVLTFFSGFGLGTILMPVFALFFPVEVAIALTAVVHLANNLFKTVLIRKDIDLRVVALFALPAAAAAVLGALLLNVLSNGQPLFTYRLGSSEAEITLVKLVIAVLLALFALMEIDSRFDRFTFSRSLLPLGGVLSGFFGGLSGHQGALRSMFLLRAGLSKEAFIATGVAAAVVIDISRLAVYGASFFTSHLATVGRANSFALVIVACVAAFAGSWFGRKMLRKVTMRSVQLVVGVMILLFALLLGSGVI